MAERRLPLRLEQQRNEVADDVGALIAVVRPILLATLFALKHDVVAQVGGHENVALRMLPRLYRRGDGDCGISFEYAVHDALIRQEPAVTERIEEALTRHCNVPGNTVTSILFGAEKSGALDLIETAREMLTPESALLYGTRGRPAKLQRHIAAIAAAFRRQAEQIKLPTSIRGLWKADLFIGHSDSDRWVGTTVKINPERLEAARGLRIGVVPARHGHDDRVYRDERRNLIVCPLPYDGAFMEVFYRGWRIVQQFISADAEMPREVNLPDGADRIVVGELVDRKEFPVIDVVDAIAAQAQPELLQTTERQASIFERRDFQLELGAAVAPIPLRSRR